MSPRSARERVEAAAAATAAGAGGKAGAARSTAPVPARGVKGGSGAGGIALASPRPPARRWPTRPSPRGTLATARGPPQQRRRRIRRVQPYTSIPPPNTPPLPPRRRLSPASHRRPASFTTTAAISPPSGRSDGGDSAKVAPGVGVAGGDVGDGPRCLTLAVPARQRRRQAVCWEGAPATRCGFGISPDCQQSKSRRDSVHRLLGVAVPPPPPRPSRGVSRRRRRRPRQPRRRRCRHRCRAGDKRRPGGSCGGGHPHRGRVWAGGRVTTADADRWVVNEDRRGEGRHGGSGRRYRHLPAGGGDGGSPAPPRRQRRRRAADRAWRPSRPPPTGCRRDMR